MKVDMQWERAINIADIKLIILDVDTYYFAVILIKLRRIIILQVHFCSIGKFILIVVELRENILCIYTHDSIIENEKRKKCSACIVQKKDREVISTLYPVLWIYSLNKLLCNVHLTHFKFVSPSVVITIVIASLCIIFELRCLFL